VTDVVREGSLKLVVAWSRQRSLDSVVETFLSKYAGVNDLQRLTQGCFVIHTAAEPSELRDELSAILIETESVIVVQFERWSSAGSDIDTRWLLRRGH
jgi:hypothetical protein